MSDTGNNSQVANLPRDTELTRTRTNRVCFRLSDEEFEVMVIKMEETGIKNREAFLRKTVLEGHVVRIDFSDIRTLNQLLYPVANNINQIARNANQTGIVYASDVRKIQGDLDEIMPLLKQALKSLANL